MSRLTRTLLLGSVLGAATSLMLRLAAQMIGDDVTALPGWLRLQATPAILGSMLLVAALASYIQQLIASIRLHIAKRAVQDPRDVNVRESSRHPARPTPRIRVPRGVRTRRAARMPTGRTRRSP